LNKIDENWDLFEHKTKIRTYLKKLDENRYQKGILTFNFIFYFQHNFSNNSKPNMIEHTR